MTVFARQVYANFLTGEYNALGTTYALTAAFRNQLAASPITDPLIVDMNGLAIEETSSTPLVTSSLPQSKPSAFNDAIFTTLNSGGILVVAMKDHYSSLTPPGQSSSIHNAQTYQLAFAGTASFNITNLLSPIAGQSNFSINLFSGTTQVGGQSAVRNSFLPQPAPLNDPVVQFAMSYDIASNEVAISFNGSPAYNVPMTGVLGSFDPTKVVLAWPFVEQIDTPSSWIEYMALYGTPDQTLLSGLSIGVPPPLLNKSNVSFAQIQYQHLPGKPPLVRR